MNEPAALVSLSGLLATFRSRTFRWILLGMALAPCLAVWIFTTLYHPLASHFDYPNDGSVYLDAARQLASGHDPYAFFHHETARGIDPALQGSYIYPPLLAWVLQPLTGLSVNSQRIVLLLFDQLCFWAAFALAIRILRVASAQRMVAYTCLQLAFMPNWENMFLLQVNPLMALLTVTWAWAWADPTRTRAAVGAVSLGLGIAIKLLQAPLLLLPLLRRRAGYVLVALGALAVPTALASPGLLPEYFTTVLPALAGGSPSLLNQSPAALLTRFAHPASIYIAHYAPLPASRFVTVALGAVVLVILLFTLRVRHAATAPGETRLSEASLLIAASPLFSTLVWAPHTALLLLPFLFLLERGWVQRNRLYLFAAGFFYVALGPARMLLIALLKQHVADASVQWAIRHDQVAAGWDLAFRLWALSGPVALILLFIASVICHQRSSRPPQVLGNWMSGRFEQRALDPQPLESPAGTHIGEERARQRPKTMSPPNSPL